MSPGPDAHRPQYTAGELADRFGLEVRGDAATTVTGVATIADAAPDRLTFLSNSKYRAALAATRAGIVVLAAGDAEAAPGTALVARDPYSAYARIAALFETLPSAPPGIHPSAVVDASASIDPTASIGPHVSIGARSVVHAGATIGPGCVIGDDCIVGEGTRLVARVTLVTRARLGARVLVHPGAVLGADGFGIAMEKGTWLKVPQLGGVVVGDDCEIGANTTIDRGAIDDTVLEEDVRLDNQIQIGHNVRVGAHTAMAGCVAVAGSTRIGRYCLIGGGAGIVGHIELCDRVVVTAMSLVTHSIREPGEYSSGTPLMDNRAWRRAAARFRQLDRLFRSRRD
ncbi:UDP-3-O-(3-hydroxymyristoyl)glucosamine N-acyltransferase [Lysobacter sp. TY2-98]|uniref:UDP-3-O-(3-hydroxymyristoyl)glucosamine N-acyltransferase n=1 Tax=Lysobacter sp. TY2-98 TaxID=2290922 RepID=UPI000E20654E|nr:UDP-3-O-(3-hydroxymyristoyl)glucosamine N-acyltransferase [Lysobacter sp. TY2-98]AXK71577.1 UDP-3-O-(3-hydroxymyristoyl)glucosamine N-acyltransferase [Lysobacter sp. TY2-98]